MVHAMSTPAGEMFLIDQLGRRMTIKLEENRHKPHWLSEDKWHMYRRLKDEVRELYDAIENERSTEEIWREAADIANFAAFVADIYQLEEEMR